MALSDAPLLPPLVMDSGLLLCASQPADESGFVPYGRAGNAEAVALKGMLWARFGVRLPACLPACLPD